jgi:hypothetical protein
MRPCRYCDEMAPADCNVCPSCGKWNPAGELRCPRCRFPVREVHRTCAGCGQKLEVACPSCGLPTFFGDHCGQCGARLTVRCLQKKCGFEQPPLGDMCSKCGRPISGARK